MKKWFTFLLALIMCLSLCACGGSNESKDTSTEDAEKLLKNTPLKDFREKVASLSHDQAVELANMAVDLKVTDYQRAQILKEKTEIDVFKAAVAAQEEADKTANN